MDGNGAWKQAAQAPPWPLLLLVRDKIMRVIASVVAVICCGALVACFHHRQAVVEYAPPALDSALQKQKKAKSLRLN
jgi:hypothetical protein